MGPSKLFYSHPLIYYLGEDNNTANQPILIKVHLLRLLIDLLRGEKVRPGMDIKTLIQGSLDEGKTAWGKVQIDEQTLIYPEFLMD